MAGPQFMVCEVEATYGGTINTGSFENIKLEYTVHMKCLVDEAGPVVTKALQDAHMLCKQMFDVKAAAIKNVPVRNTPLQRGPK